jgi:UDP:flavonoid glycosyltransferase YjiC (YdhE family)
LCSFDGDDGLIVTHPQPASAAALAEALIRATSDAAMSQRAAALAEKIRAEDGVKTTLEIFSRYLS